YNSLELYKFVSADAEPSQLTATIDDSRNTSTGTSWGNQAIAQQCSQIVVTDRILTGDNVEEAEICLGTHFEPIRFQAVIRPKVESRPIAPAMKTAQKGIVEISINLYGTSTMAKAISDALSRERKFLQHPDVVDPGVDYVNPQYFMPPGESGVLNNMVGARDWKSSSVHTISLEVDRIMDSLSEVDSNIDMLLNSDILTPLLRSGTSALSTV
ncbi:MAG: hypothetical protein Q9167_006081, partial [Letrouitia subvulpina]